MCWSPGADGGVCIHLQPQKKIKSQITSMQDIFQSHKSEGAYVIHMGDDARRSG